MTASVRPGSVAAGGRMTVVWVMSQPSRARSSAEAAASRRRAGGWSLDNRVPAPVPGGCPGARASIGVLVRVTGGSR